MPFIFPSGFSHLFPVINFFPLENLFTVKRQLFPQPPHLIVLVTIFISPNSSFDTSVVSLSAIYLSLLINAAPNAPIIPEISGRTTLIPVTFSKLLRTPSL